MTDMINRLQQTITNTISEKRKAGVYDKSQEFLSLIISQK